MQSTCTSQTTPAPHRASSAFGTTPGAASHKHPSLHHTSAPTEKGEVVRSRLTPQHAVLNRPRGAELLYGAQDAQELQGSVWGHPAPEKPNAALFQVPHRLLTPATSLPFGPGGYEKERLSIPVASRRLHEARRGEASNSHGLCAPSSSSAVKITEKFLQPASVWHNTSDSRCLKYVAQYLKCMIIL